MRAVLPRPTHAGGRQGLARLVPPQERSPTMVRGFGAGSRPADMAGIPHLLSRTLRSGDQHQPPGGSSVTPIRRLRRQVHGRLPGARRTRRGSLSLVEGSPVHRRSPRTHPRRRGVARACKSAASHAPRARIRTPQRATGFGPSSTTTRPPPSTGASGGSSRHELGGPADQALQAPHT